MIWQARPALALDVVALRVRGVSTHVCSCVWGEGGGGKEKGGQGIPFPRAPMTSPWDRLKGSGTSPHPPLPLPWPARLLRRNEGDLAALYPGRTRASQQIPFRLVSSLLSALSSFLSISAVMASSALFYFFGVSVQKYVSVRIGTYPSNGFHLQLRA